MWKAFWAEITYIFQDRRTLGILFGGPLIITLFFGYLYSNAKLTDMPTVIFDQDKTYLSREVINAFNTSEKFSITGYASTLDEIEHYLRRGEAMAAVVIPHDFSKDIKTGQATEVLIISDGSSILYANTIGAYAGKLVSTFSAGLELKSLEGMGIPADQAEKIVSAISFRTRVWYNPTYNYQKFLAPGLILMGIQQTLLIAVAMALFRTRREDDPTVLYSTPSGAPETVGLGSSFNIFFKILPYVLLGTVMLLFCQCVAYLVFNIQLGQDMIALTLMSVAFCLSTVALGTVIALIAPTLDFAIQLAMLIAAPTFIMSGFTWPLMVIPEPIRSMALAIPLTHYLDAMRAVTMKNAVLGDVTTQVMSMFIIAGVLIPLSMIIHYYKTKQPVDKLSAPDQQHIEL